MELPKGSSMASVEPMGIGATCGIGSSSFVDAGVMG